MMSPFKIGIIDSNILACIGLQRMLGELMPMAEISVFYSAEMFLAQDHQHYVHFFVSSRVYFEHADFFRNHPHKTIVMVNGAMNISNVFTLNVCQAEQSLVRDIMGLQHKGHDNKSGGVPPVLLHDKAHVLSPRETEVAVLLSKGYINKEIADRLDVSLSTVITHRKNIMEKLHGRSLADIIIYCVSNGIVDIEEL